uniref:Uncharacterized protein n=1 Tax=Chromera velia CCMP2878 TaxID=1169474 RepID=A0A0G4HR42_9ALVE|eukprot:Cvel_30394.t1-p1 / transcript=Cvel_30394.t1 / gene=Cvel_30394 / organism=Chromera_velia_CCMP2878 / gene_product=hypothetical protein / transcript_product=hypothetical protein / location=Cvel_scaffold4325:1776-7822(+) / protein_length=167 / sequence_SO=supercontig / SO=protein_coding / is_pseudo=false
MEGKRQREEDREGEIGRVPFSTSRGQRNGKEREHRRKETLRRESPLEAWSGPGSLHRLPEGLNMPFDISGEYDSEVLKVSDDFIHFFSQGVGHWSRLLKDRISSLDIDLHLDSLKGAYLFLCWEELYVFKEQLHLGGFDMDIYAIWCSKHMGNLVDFSLSVAILFSV